MRVAGVALGTALLLVLLAASDGVTICHHPGPLEDPFGSNAITITVASPALKAHLGHGDTIGACKPSATPRPAPTPRPTPQPTPRATQPPRPTPAPTRTPATGPTVAPTAMPPLPPTDTR